MKPFPTSAACCFGILFISVSLITTGSSEVVGSADTVVALTGDDVILPCFLKTSVSAKNMVVEWTRLNLTPENVHLYRDNRDSYEEQHPFYRGRTSLFNDELKNGNVSLKLTRVTLSDAGSYRCFIPTLTSQVKETTVQLFVGAVSQPVISIDGTKGRGLVLKCESGGWYPEPEMEWLDSSGSILPADGPPERHRDSEGRYTVRRHVTVNQTDTNRFTCRVQQLKINHKKETEIHVPDDLFPKGGAKSYVWLIVGLPIAAAVLAASAVGVYMWRKHKGVSDEEDPSSQELMGLNEKLRREKGDAQFVDMNRVHLIQTVTTVIPIAFYLIRSEKYSEIHAAGTREDQMELLYQALDSGGVKMKSDFYRILQDLQPDAVKDLAPSTMQFDYRFPKSRMWWIVLLLIAAAIVLTAFAVVYLQRELEDYRFPKSHLGLIVGLLIAAAVGVLAASAVVGYMWRKHEGVSDEEDPSSPPSTMQFEELIRLNEENDRISLIDT